MCAPEEYDHDRLLGGGRNLSDQRRLSIRKRDILGVVPFPCHRDVLAHGEDDMIGVLRVVDRLFQKRNASSFRSNVCPMVVPSLFW